jgi:hypothetical protein
MRSLLMIGALAFALVVVGCSSASQQVVGTWKGELMPRAEDSTSKKPSDIGKALESGIKGMLNAFIGPLTLEFNADGKYKASVNLGSSTGTYSVSGNEITLNPDEKADRKNEFNIGTLVLSSDGKTIHSKKEFNSDSVMELKKQP